MRAKPQVKAKLVKILDMNIYENILFYFFNFYNQNISVTIQKSAYCLALQCSLVFQFNIMYQYTVLANDV